MTNFLIEINNLLTSQFVETKEYKDLVLLYRLIVLCYTSRPAQVVHYSIKYQEKICII